MWPFISPVNLIRYLIVWRVNGSLIQLPRCLSTSLSLTLGNLIAERLPTRPSRAWRKTLGTWGEATEAARKAPIPETAWPIEAVLFPYPGKRTYGQGESILWELKLLGPSADHGLFLELILPAMEEAAMTTDPRWRQSNGLWGRFDIQAIYVARGLHWEPLVSDGRLDLSYRASPTQWAEGLTFGLDLKRRFHRLTWITPVDLGKSVHTPLVFGETGSDGGDARPANPSHPSAASKSRAAQVPTISAILAATMARMTLFLPGKRPTPDQAWALLSPAEQATLRLELDVPSKHRLLKPAPKGWPGRWIGSQTFTMIPPSVVPYLELASILHVGRQTHFGCGTFTLT